MSASETKRWGNRPFWGLSFDYDPQWFLTEEQKEIQKRLIELCRTTLRPNAVSFVDWFIDGIYVVSKIIEAAGNLVIAGVLRPSYITHGSKMTFFDLKQFHRVFWDLNSTPLKCDVKNRHWFHLFWFRLYLKALACFFLENNFCYHKFKKRVCVNEGTFWILSYE